MGRNEYLETERLQAAADLGRRFIQRWDLYAKQLADGRYVCVRKPLSGELLLAHLQGEVTLGAYLMDQNSNIRFLVIDADAEDGLTKLAEFSEKVKKEGMTAYLEASRRGGHAWLFFKTAVPAELGRRFGKGLISKFGLENVELYPKQDKTVDGGPGSLIKLPFGVHLKSGQRYPFVTSDGELLAPTVREQIRILADAQTVPEAAIYEFADFQPEKPVKPPFKPLGEPTDASWEKIKERISVIDFVGQYVDLRPTASGAVGRCPFHDDQHASFGVNAKGNYWNCFAESGCGGGSIIDFWKKWRGIDFKEAVDELADLLGVDKNGRDLHRHRSGTLYEAQPKKDKGPG